MIHIVMLLLLVSVVGCAGASSGGSNASDSDVLVTSQVDAKSQILYNDEHIGTYQYIVHESSYDGSTLLKVFPEKRFTLTSCYHGTCIRYFEGINLSDLEKSRSGYLNYIYRDSASISFPGVTMVLKKISNNHPTE